MPAAADAAGGGFLPLFAEVCEALLDSGSEIALRNLSFDARRRRSRDAGRSARILATLQRVETGLGEAGLTVASGVATTGNGAAEVRYVIGGPGR